MDNKETFLGRSFVRIIVQCIDGTVHIQVVTKAFKPQNGFINVHVRTHVNVPVHTVKVVIAATFTLNDIVLAIRVAAGGQDTVVKGFIGVSVGRASSCASVRRICGDCPFQTL